ncbi:MAG: zf-HC2 domain-containing protein [Myxococcaceae bacterium]|nr:zf-HC2 domain-containing protein [Myxococcaceae bacterium]
MHQYEDKLLELAYGELPPGEASAVESHVRSCSRCTEALSEIRSVRSTMGQLPMEPVPDTGLESLFAYADQAARRNAAGPAPTATWWRKLMAPLMAAGALSVIGVVAYQSSREGEPLPTRAAIAEESQRKVDSLTATPIQPAEAPAPVAGAAPEPELGAREEQKQAPAKTAMAPAKPEPAKKKMSGYGDGAELGDMLQQGAKLSKSKNEKEVVLDNSWGNSGATARKGGYVANEDDAPADAKKVETKAQESNKVARANDKAGKDEWGAPAGNAGAAQPRAAPSAEQVAPSAPPPPPPAQAAPPQQQASQGSGSFGLGVGNAGSQQQMRGGGGMTQEGRLSERERDSRAGEAQAPSVGSTADRRSDVVSDLNARIQEMKRERSARNTEAEMEIAFDIFRTAPARSPQRLQALSSICNGFYALEEPSRAEPYCGMMMREYPNSAEAQAYAARQNSARPAAKRAKTRSSYDFDEEAAKPAPAERQQQRQSDPAPASSY